MPSMVSVDTWPPSAPKPDEPPRPPVSRLLTVGGTLIVPCSMSFSWLVSVTILPLVFVPVLPL
ncbi:hypothetical protein D3C87_1365390 [compost metagenome]